MTSTVHALTPVEILGPDWIDGYCTSESSLFDDKGTLTPNTIDGAEIVAIWTDMDFSELWVELKGDLAQDFFDSVETVQHGVLLTASADTFQANTLMGKPTTTQWAWESQDSFNNLGVERDVTFTGGGGGKLTGSILTNSILSKSLLVA